MALEGCIGCLGTGEDCVECCGHGYVERCPKCLQFVWRGETGVWGGVAEDWEHAKEIKEQYGDHQGALDCEWYAQELRYLEAHGRCRHCDLDQC
jgi:hypothetical protein